MENDQQNSFLQFDFNTEYQQEPFIFTNPKTVIVARHIDEIEDCLNKIKHAVASGYYVAGYMSYEAAGAFFPHIKLNINTSMPLLWFGVYDKLSKVTARKENKTYEIGKWELNLSKFEYEEHFKRIQDEIMRENIEQINYTAQFNTTFSGDGYSYYQKLRNAQQSNFSAYVNINDFEILSASPELFFELHHGEIKLKPMKGTIHRGNTFDEDIANYNWLRTSNKNKFENKLTTNLMMEEIKGIIDPTSIRVTDEFLVEKFPTVYQMTSTIQAKLLDNISTTDIFKALFPCSSIAGTPKETALKLISEIEETSREVYCGAIGYITPENQAIFNVPIRTVIIDKQEQVAKYGAGGAITKHSVVDDEYREVLTKSEILHVKHTHFDLLETFGLYDGEFIVYDLHLRRLQASAAYFNFTINLQDIEEKLNKYARNFSDGKWIVRLTLAKSGEFTVTIKSLQSLPTNKVVLATEPINQDNAFFYHKTTNREIYKRHRENLLDVFDVLLWNEAKEITEFTIGNIVVELDGQQFTPPVNCGLLPGTFRQELLDKKEIQERVITINDLDNCTNIWLINSVRQWINVTF